jgi:hypothetical protein
MREGEGEGKKVAATGMVGLRQSSMGRELLRSPTVSVAVGGGGGRAPLELRAGAGAEHGEKVVTTRERRRWRGVLKEEDDAGRRCAGGSALACTPML